MDYILVTLILLILLILFVSLLNVKDSFVVNDPNFHINTFGSKCIFLNENVDTIRRDFNIPNQIELPQGEDLMNFNDLNYNFDEDYGIMNDYYRNYKYYGIKG